MKTIQLVKTFSWALIMLMLMTACEKDGDSIYLSSLDGNDLVATKSTVALSKETATQVVLSLAWTAETLAVSNPDMSAPNVVSSYLQVSTQNDFAAHSTESVETGLSKAYSGAELNALAKALNMEPNVSTPVYFRLKSKTGNNMEPVYSNVVTINITSYLIDMSVGFILDKDKAPTATTLSSTQSDGVYKGFMGAAGWSNFFLQEGDGTTWGNDAATGTPFLLSSDASSWNCWFPGITGCYYTIVDTPKKTWSALLLTSMKVSGDIQADMTFDRPNVKWTTAISASKASTYKIKLNANGKQYDYATGTDDAAAVSTAVAFTAAGDVISMAPQAGEITVSVPQAGDYTLVVDLSNPKAWTCKLVAGSDQPVVVSPYVYLPGVDDRISGKWTFDNSLPLYNEDKQAYAGVVNVNSQWGYSINPEKDNWDNKYTMATGDAYAGTLVAKGENNLPAPAVGLYLIETSIKALTYSLTGIGNEIYVLGLNDKWEFDTPLTATATVGVYKGSITINGASPWGFSIHLKNGDWDRKYGGSNGKLYYRGNNITDDASLAVGTYQMTVDLINGTYTIVK